MINNIVEKYKPIVDMMAETFGPECEIVIHDLSVPQNSVVYTINSHVTGRKVGQSFEHLVTQVLLSQNFHNNYASNYHYKTPDGRVIRSSTVLLRDDDEKVVAAICVNIDTKITEIPTQEEVVVDINKLDQYPVGKDNDLESVSHVMEIVDDLIEKIIPGREIGKLKREEKLELVQFMYRKGIFLIKGAIDKVSERLGVSKVTVYSYIDDIKEGNGK